MKILLLVILSCTTQLVLSKTQNYTIEHVCNDNYTRSSHSALAYTGTYAQEQGGPCQLGFRLMDSQQNFTLHIARLSTSSWEGVVITILQKKYREPSIFKRIFNKTFHSGTHDYTETLPSSSNFLQMIVIDVVHEQSHNHANTVSLQLVVTPNFNNSSCNHSRDPNYMCASSGECVHSQLTCDGFKNCKSGEDEAYCSSAKPIYTSSPVHAKSTSPSHVHANATSPSHVHANATSHSHVHANATSISRVHAKSTSTSHTQAWSSPVFPWTDSAFSTTSNSTVVYVFWWWHSWYLSTMVFIAGFFFIALIFGLCFCCMRKFVTSRKTRTTASAVSASAPPEDIQISVVNPKDYAELPPTYDLVVKSPPQYEQVAVFLDSPCGNSNPIN